MPLDGHGYLVNQGWSGKGKGLREGAISRPLAIPQKKTLSGLGKDRDEAFPFWDHLFSAAAKSIQVKCLSDDEDSENSNTVSALKRTSTGILSNRRPLDGTPATSGSSTPFPESEASRPTLSLIATAKRDAAKRGLYSRFFRGPVLGPDSLAEEEKRLTALVAEVLSDEPAPVQVTIKEHIDIETSEGHTIVDLEVSGSSKKKRRKAKNEEGVEGDEEAKRERKRRKREEKKAKERDKEEKKARKEAKRAKKLAKLEAQQESRNESGDLTDQKSKSLKKAKQVSEDETQLSDKPKKKRRRDSSASGIT